MVPRTGKRLQDRTWDNLDAEAASLGLLFSAPVSTQSSKDARFIACLELFADTGAKKGGAELAASLRKPSNGLVWEHARASKCIQDKIIS